MQRDENNRTSMSVDKMLSTQIGIIAKINNREKVEQLRYWVNDWIINNKLTPFQAKIFQLTEEEIKIIYQNEEKP